MSEARTCRVVAGDGLPLHVRCQGDPQAPTVVCVHGYPDDSTLWDGVAGLLRDRYHVVAYDVRGAGRSPAPRERNGYHLDRLAEDLLRVADTVSPDRPVHVLAHDWGSIQSWHAVTEEHAHHRFASFTSVSGPCLDHVAHWMRAQARGGLHARWELAVQRLLSGYIVFFHLRPLPELAWLTGIGGPVLSLLERVGEHEAPSHGRALRDLLNGLGLYRANVRERLRAPQERRTPVLVQVLAPAHDVFVTAAMQGAVRRWAPNSRVVRVPGGHWMPRARPEVVARHTIDLVSSVEAGRGVGG
ncbi:alpha/beta fold hydrolase [Marinactinospora thermotolerans]|uniref:Pimeloyl-ACP methyl ester carboxylesterase n=1 Tax=Marinactinospora thermotolerans DSM 45154 TaxID=1122192 RepID=A0A1T4PTH6_9ACTN|nr:alpha/beta fold hydrolase [Marinactinospora thermotolerans]SJZ94830.1 Pimeloyl-ACP methyl ester carboxylesterase [Marinactinospora thermotolerans DSM 45154]